MSMTQDEIQAMGMDGEGLCKQLDILAISKAMHLGNPKVSL